LPAPDTVTSDRAPVRQSAEAVAAQEGQLRVARADRLPSLAITSAYQRLFFPSQFFPSLNQFSENWNVGGSISLSLFSGGRVTGNIEVAQANLDQARAQLQQTKELAALDTRVAFNQLEQAEASFAASRGTATQAQRAYSIDQIRYREGISTQTDLLQSRLLMEQAAAQQAVSARDLAVARARVVLLRDLPIDVQGVGGAAARAAQQQQQQQQQQLQQQQQQPLPQQQPSTSTAASQAGAGPSGSFTQ
jgi:outer membrane protein